MSLHTLRPHPATPATRGRVLALALLALAQFIMALDYNIVYVALPQIGDHLGFSAQTLQWVASAYTVVFGGFLLFGGRLSDLLGRRRMFVAGLLLYGVSSLVGGLASTPGILVAARAVQGLGGAVLFPATFSLVTTMFAEGPERNRAMSVWAGAGAAGMVSGSLLGGLLTDAFGWPAVFVVNVPLAVVAAAAAVRLLPTDARFIRGRRFDLPGALTATAGITSVVSGLVQGPETGWNSPIVMTSLVAGTALLILFAAIEYRSADPLMPIRLLTSRNLGTGVATTFLFAATFATLLYFLTIYFQGVLGFSALSTGAAFIIPTTGVLIGSAVGGRLATAIGTRRTLFVGLPLGAAGTILLGLLMSPGRSLVALAPALVLLGIGQGITYTTMYAAASTGVAIHQHGVAAGMASTGQQVGSAVGLALLVALANSTGNGLRPAMFAAAGGIALMVIVAANFRFTNSPDRV
ncbi:MFS transporter [Jiangella mangrovi]|uniref:EmrB/QacA subfamily drug resistance transporter n=1 Tax=Jiangella mangrovi TaxID=1524084 RepID=A0A7W9LNZ0_9ACTN|nr:MFS transporter [Jiangella mangrovi]MBB5790766.1 EmrB/QacA subfamily drug resistance transporter [Jiangella mangrovi]